MYIFFDNHFVLVCAKGSKEKDYLKWLDLSLPWEVFFLILHENCCNARDDKNMGRIIISTVYGDICLPSDLNEWRSKVNISIPVNFHGSMAWDLTASLCQAPCGVQRFKLVLGLRHKLAKLQVESGDLCTNAFRRQTHVDQLVLSQSSAAVCSKIASLI